MLVTRRDYEQIFLRLKELNEEIESDSGNKSEKGIFELSESLSSKSSEFLAGVIGGVTGFSSGISLTFLGGVTFLVGPLGAMLGIAVGILIWRGGGQHRIERVTRKFTNATEIIKSELASLPAGTPKSTRDKLWKKYDDIVDEYQKIVLGAMKDDRSRFNRLN